MKKLALYAILILGLVGCSSDKDFEESHPSPSGEFKAQVLIGNESSNRKYIIFIQLLAKNGRELDVVDTGASVFQNYAVYWDSEKTIVLYSSDIGTLAWLVSDQKLLAISVDNKMAKRAEAFFNKKMGR